MVVTKSRETRNDHLMVAEFLAVADSDSYGHEPVPATTELSL